MRRRGAPLRPGLSPFRLGLSALVVLTLLLVARSGPSEEAQRAPTRATKSTTTTESPPEEAPDAVAPAPEPESPVVEPGELRLPEEAPATTTTTARPAQRAAPPAALPVPAPPPASGRTWHVAAGTGATDAGDGSDARPFSGLAPALGAAQPGDVVELGPGTYKGPVATVRGGRPDAPIRIVGRGARIDGNGEGRLVEILHSHVTLEHLELTDADILVYVFGATGVRLLDNDLHDADTECVRIKFFSSHNEVAGNRIRKCGKEGFDLSDHKKNGEGVYIGTAPEQRSRNPRPDPDASDGNWVHDNVFETPAECVDVKEAASGTVVERNQCRNGRDPDSAGFSSRGRGTIFRDNISTGHAGAGIRLGGDAADDGTGTEVRGNQLTGNRGYGLKILSHPQGPICGNDVSGNGDGPTNEELNPALPC